MSFTENNEEMSHIKAHFITKDSGERDGERYQ